MKDIFDGNTKLDTRLGNEDPDITCSFLEDAQVILTNSETDYQYDDGTATLNDPYTQELVDYLMSVEHS